MTPTADFLQQLLFDGRLVVGSMPPDPRDAAGQVQLAKAHRVLADSLAGPELPLVPARAWQAIRALHHAAVLLLETNRPVEADDPLLTMDTSIYPEEHLSVDLIFQYLPTVLRRARALRPNDVFVEHLERLLRQWPLSGVLTDIADPPLVSLEFGGHRGLQFLYAERLARHERPGWFPTGDAFEAVELVWHYLGKDPAALTSLRNTLVTLSPKEA